MRFRNSHRAECFRWSGIAQSGSADQSLDARPRAIVRNEISVPLWTFSPFNEIDFDSSGFRSEFVFRRVDSRNFNEIQGTVVKVEKSV